MSKYLNLLTETNQVHILERIKTSSQSEIDELDNQIKGVKSTYPGGIKKYIENAKKAIFNSKNNINYHKMFFSIQFLLLGQTLCLR